MSEIIVVIKKNPKLEEVWRYEGKIISKQKNEIKIEARFNRDDMPFYGVLLKRNDIFLETFFSNKWYNIFEIYDRDDHQLKGRYCNVCHPAVFDQSTITYIDLAIDLFVLTDGTQFVLDLDEFEDLNLDKQTKKEALKALEQLKKLKYSSP
jgi:predicted RNA-binding protein associated with RNAse of E/G family